MKRMLRTGLMLVLAGSLAASAAPSEEPQADEEKLKRQQEVATQLLEMSRLQTPFDWVGFSVSGPAVVLEGFCTKAVIKTDSEKAVQKLDWVTHVVNKIDFIPADPAGNDIRKETLSILRKAAPQAFPENRANIRIKVDQAYNVTLVGVIAPTDEKRLEAAIVRINSLPLVKGVENKVRTRTE